MGQIHIKNVKYVNSDDSDPAATDLTTALGSATAKVCHESGGNLDVEQLLIKQMSAESQLPYEVYPVGTDMKGKLTLLGDTMDDLAAQMNTTVTTNTILIKAKPDSLAAIPNRAIMFQADILGTGTRTYILTCVKFEGKLNLTLNNKNDFNLPISFFGTKDSQLSIVQS